MSSRRSGPSLLLDKNFIFLNTKGLCLLCYEECPVQTLDKRQETTQTSVNFLRLVSRYLGFSVDNVVVTPLKKVGRKCATDKEQQNDKKFDKVGFELCERCASLAHAFCQVQFQVQFHQMILDRCVRSISEIIKDANKKTAAELFTMSEDADSMKKQQKTFTRLTMGGLRSANILRNKLYKRSMYKLSKSFPVIKLKRICKSGDWIQLLNKNENKDLSKTLPVDSKDVIFASLLGCVVSFWIVLSLSFINPEEYSLNVKKEKTLPTKNQSFIPAMPLNCAELEIELKFPSKRKTELSKQEAPNPAQASHNQRPSSATSSTASIAQQRNQVQPQTALPPVSNFQPVVIHKHINPVIQSKKLGSQCEPPPVKSRKVGGPGQHQSDPAWKPKSSQYPTSLQALPPGGPLAKPVIMPPFASSSTQPASQYPIQPPPPTPPQYPTPPPTSHLPPPSNYGFTYPSYPPNHLANNESHSNSISQHSHPQYNHNDSENSSYNYNYNFTSYNYSSSSSWPSYNMAAIDPNPPPSYTPPVNPAYDPYNTSNMHGSDPGNLSNSPGYNYGYDYNSYIPPGQPPVNAYQHQTGSSQYNMSTNHMPGDIYSTNSDQTGGGYNNNDNNESTSYTTLLPPVSTSNSYATTSSAAVSVPMEVDNTNTSTSDEPSLTHEDPQLLDSENSSMNGDDDSILETETGNEAGGPQPPQLLFPETHWRQTVGSSPPISCKEPGCTEQFVTPIQLQIHLRTHGEFQCSFCHLTFSKAHNLAQHEKMRHCKSSGLGKHKCPRCDYTSTSQYKYFLHFLTYHLRIPLYDKPCNICNKPFILGTKTINRKNHFKWYHDVDGKDPNSVFTCKGCGAPFLKDAQLRDHQPNCTSIASVSSTESIEEIDYNTAVATADQIVL